MENRSNFYAIATVCVLICLLHGGVGLTAETPRLTGVISDVTVYHGQAQITRQIDLDLPGGTSEIIVTGLPNRIISDSIFAQTQGSVTVLSVRYRERAVERDTRKEVKALDEQIVQVNDEIRHVDRRKGHWDNQWSMFIKLRDFTIEAKQNDLSRGILVFDPIAQLVDMIQAKGAEYIEQAITYEDQAKELKKKLELLIRKRDQLNAGRSRTEREAVIYVNKIGTNNGPIMLSYLVEGANWYTQYNLRAKPDQSKVVVEHNAVVNQTSGEDWNEVSLTLSTAEPTLVAAAPTLDPMQITLGPGAPTMPIAVDMPSKIRREREREQSGKSGIAQQQAKRFRYQDISSSFRENLQRRQSASNKGFAANTELNVVAVQNQLFELEADKKQVQMLQEEAKRFAQTEGVSVAYVLAGKLTLPSRTDQQLLNIARIDSDSQFTLVATPLLTEYIYRQADITNDSDKVFLPGPASMYYNGDFVGKGRMKLVTMGETFTAGFGIDSQIQISREFKDKKTNTMWGSRIEQYDYRIAIDNYKKDPVKLRLLDRLPYVEDAPIEVRDFVTSTILSTDSEYLRTARKKGILRWDLTLAPQSFKDKATVVTYSYTMKYDSDMHVVAASGNNN